MDITQIILLLTPVMVWVATQLVKYILSAVPGWVVVGLIVPALSIIITLVLNYAIALTGNFWVQVGIGLLAVFINEVYKQLKLR